MLPPTRCFLDYSKVFSDVTEKWLLGLNQNKQIAYYMFYILIPNSVLIFYTVA